MKLNSDTDNLSEYFERVNQRVHKGEDLTRMIFRIMRIARSAEKHFERLEIARRRLSRAVTAPVDDIAVKYEEKVILALLYEIADTGYMVLQLLDLEKLGLTSSTSGDGIVGDAAVDTLNVLSLLENHCQRLLSLEGELKLKIDFSVPVAEREGVTYKEYPHWDSFVPGNYQSSFQDYFANVKEELIKRMNQVPTFWRSQTFGQFLERRGYSGIVTLTQRLIHSKIKVSV